MSFTHLHLHTLYSVLDGAIRMKDLVKPILGMEAYVAGPQGRADRNEKVAHHSGRRTLRSVEWTE